MKDERFEKTELAVWADIGVNMIHAIVKGAIGFMANSKALLSDSAHSISDVVSSVAGLMKRRTSKLAADKVRLSGHRETSSTSSLVVCLLLLIIGVETGMSAARALWYGVNDPPKAYALAAVGISLIIKELMFLYTNRLGKQRESSEPNPGVQNRRSYIYPSFVALLGIAGALLGKYVSIPALYYLDPCAGLVVSFLVLRMGYSFSKEALPIPVDQAEQQENTADLIAAAQSIIGVITVDSLQAIEQGHYVIVEMKISVNPKVSVWEGHEIAKKVKRQLMKRFHHISDVIVLVLPYDAGYPYKNTTDHELGEYSSVIH